MTAAIREHLHNSCNVTATIGIVGRRPDGNENLLLERVLIPFSYKLMSSGNELDVVFADELKKLWELLKKS